MSEATTQPENQDAAPRFTVLRERHEALGASFTDFGGWQMPVRYGSDIAEHAAVREAAGLFDISHMAEFRIQGPGVGAFLDFALAGRLSAIAVGKAKYSLILSDTGGVIDDVIVYRLAEEEYLVIANAGNRDAAFTALQARAGGFEIALSDVTDDYALLAVQGPAAERILAQTAGIEAVSIPWAEQRYYAWASAHFAGAPLLIARTGYTGEDGFELLVRSADGPALWDAVMVAGQSHGLIPAGLAARDTLRLEAGMPLYGHELTRDIHPAQAGLGKVIVADKESFVGKGTAPAAGARVLVGLVAEGRRAGRAGYAVVDEAGTVLGEITSGTLSPTLGHPIAMAFIDPTFAEVGTSVFLDVRGTRIPATVTALPFYRSEKK